MKLLQKIVVLTLTTLLSSLIFAEPSSGCPQGAVENGGRARERVCGYPQEATVSVLSATGEKKIFLVGIAKKEAEHAKGLMFCKDLKPKRGLFFIFDDENERFFWMQNTPIELAVVYVDHNFKVVSVKRGKPFSTDTLPSIYPAQFVLEVNWKEGASILPGDKVTFNIDKK